MATATGAIPLAKSAEDQIKRFDVHQIIQHAGLAVSFILLVVTGLPLKFSDAAVSQWWVGIWGGVEVTRSTHHFAAWVMVAVCVYHLIYLWYTIGVQKKPFPVKMIPSGRDLLTIFQEMLYFLGFRKQKPEFDRFNWREKFDYWAIFWGIPVMAGSGFILMFPVFVTRFLPGWVVPTALVAHSDEAMLALTWIFMVHIFFNHFVPGIFPVNTTMFTGKVPLERYRREHPLEFRQMMAEPVEPAEAEKKEEEKD